LCRSRRLAGTPSGRNQAVSFARVMAQATGMPEDMQRIAAARGNYDTAS
jgi:hypothetical protein